MAVRGRSSRVLGAVTERHDQKSDASASKAAVALLAVAEYGCGEKAVAPWPRDSSSPIARTVVIAPENTQNYDGEWPALSVGRTP